jgi:uncharacterized protein (DUF58 family)
MSVIPKELLSKVRRIEIRMAHLVNEVLAGEYHSSFKGQGMEFSEVREYVPGDDVRLIDWNVTARLEKPFVKQFVEERELTVILLVDVSGSSLYGSSEMTKSEISAELAALLALAAIRNKDRVGLMLFTDQIELMVTPKKGKSHVLRVVREILGFKCSHSKTSISQALKTLLQVQRRKAVIFLISDFMDIGYDKELAMVARKHDLICLPIIEKVDYDMPASGLVSFLDAETQELVTVDTSDTRIRKFYQNDGLQRLAQLNQILNRNGASAITIYPEADYLGELIRFFRRRGKRS